MLFPGRGQRDASVCRCVVVFFSVCSARARQRDAHIVHSGARDHQPLCAGSGARMLARGQCRAPVWGDVNNTAFIVESSLCKRGRAFRTRTHERITGFLQPLAYDHIDRGGAPIETLYSQLI